MIRITRIKNVTGKMNNGNHTITSVGSVILHS